LITVSTNNKPVQLTVSRLAIFQRMKIAEAKSKNNKSVFLFFLDDQFISAKTGTIAKNSRLQHVFKKGIVFESPHPLIQNYLKDNPSFTMKPLSHVLTKLQKQMSPQDIAFIFSFFDSFISSEKIIHIMKKSYYDLRRNGKLLHAFRMLMMVIDFAPKNEWAIDLSNDVAYIKYKMMYDEQGKELEKKDPSFAELYDFKNRHKKTSLRPLLSKAISSSNGIDTMALYVDSFHHSKEIDLNMYEDFLETVTEFLSVNETIEILQSLREKHPTNKRIENDLIELLASENKYEKSINLIISNVETADDMQLVKLMKLLKNDSVHIKDINVQLLFSFFNEIESSKSKYVEEILQHILPKLLNEYDLTSVYKWVEPLNDRYASNSILTIIKSMYKIKDDPEEQLSLGKNYYKLHQYKEAIDCFNWEMELKPRDPLPVQWLTKVYLEMGMKEESNTYKNIYSTMLKHA
jgi:tetratricopeptide (TPR) repeat protein